jgi:hypothetical protein
VSLLCLALISSSGRWLSLQTHDYKSSVTMATRKKVLLKVSCRNLIRLCIQAKVVLMTSIQGYHLGGFGVSDVVMERLESVLQLI